MEIFILWVLRLLYYVLYSNGRFNHLSLENIADMHIRNHCQHSEHHHPDEERDDKNSNQRYPEM